MAPASLDCAAEGVLLRDAPGKEQEIYGILWAFVITPGGVAGWASTQ